MHDLGAQRVYSARKSAFEAQRDETHRRWNRIANLRLLGFIAVAFGAWWAWRDRGPLPVLVTLIAVVVVVWLIAIHRRLKRKRDRLDDLADVNVRALARLALDWDAAPSPLPANVDRNHPFAFDLDIVGHASLAQRIATVTARTGWTVLYRWLLDKTSLEDVRRRQPAVRELAAKIEIRQAVEAIGRANNDGIPDPAPLLDWAEGGDWLRIRLWLRIVSLASPLALIALIVFQALGLLPFPYWLIPLTVNVLIFLLVGPAVSGIVAGVAPLHMAIAGYRDLFREIASDECDASALRTIRELLGSGQDGATTQVTRLTRISSLALPRGSLLYFPAQMMLLWDVQVLHLLERWRGGAGSRVRTWLDAAGEWEALAALSVLAHDHPDWAYPLVNEGAESLTARGLGHPLIDPRVAVLNDVAVGPGGTFLFVTGSNMSGKSTLLRAMGINAVLAMAGGPACARSLALPLVEIRSCMRVEDSIARGVSFFMAELQRLKGVVDASLAATDRPVLYLLDEILQGTNTAERQVASRAVLMQLSRTHAIGAISSHDLGLFEDSPLDGRSVKAHFAEHFRDGDNGPEMAFDYTLQPGIATSTNALKLMAILGFDVSADTAIEVDG